MQFYAEIPPMAQLLDKKMESTWWSDFRIGAELGGLEGIRDTYKRGLWLAQEDKIYGTEFSLVLNWLSWFYADEVNRKRYKDSLEKAKLFEELWLEFHKWILENWKGEKLDYYVRELD